MVLDARDSRWTCFGRIWYRTEVQPISNYSDTPTSGTCSLGTISAHEDTRFTSVSKATPNLQSPLLARV
jgi:hypothetical protein